VALFDATLEVLFALEDRQSASSPRSAAGEDAASLFNRVLCTLQVQIFAHAPYLLALRPLVARFCDRVVRCARGAAAAATAAVASGDGAAAEAFLSGSCLGTLVPWLVASLTIHVPTDAATVIHLVEEFTSLLADIAAFKAAHAGEALKAAFSAPAAAPAPAGRSAAVAAAAVALPLPPPGAPLAWTREASSGATLPLTLQGDTAAAGAAGAAAWLDGVASHLAFLSGRLAATLVGTALEDLPSVARAEAACAQLLELPLFGSGIDDDMLETKLAADTTQHNAKTKATKKSGQQAEAAAFRKEFEAAKSKDGNGDGFEDDWGFQDDIKGKFLSPRTTDWLLGDAAAVPASLSAEKPARSDTPSEPEEAHDAATEAAHVVYDALKQRASARSHAMEMLHRVRCGARSTTNPVALLRASPLSLHY